MAFSSKHLTQGESVALQFRTHVKKIVGPILVILAMIVLAVLAYFYLPKDGRPWTLIAVLALCAIALFIWGLIPIWKWRNTVFVLTNRRLITRTGVMAKSGRDIPLFRINDVQYEKGVSDRMLGCGTLLISDASDQPPLRLEDIPHVESVQVKINELLFAHADAQDEGGRPRAGGGQTRSLEREDRGHDDLPYDQHGQDRRTGGYDQSGRPGYDQHGQDRRTGGYDQSGRAGYDQTGRSGYDQAGYDQARYDQSGYDQSGYDQDNRGRTERPGQGYPQGRNPRDVPPGSPEQDSPPQRY